MDTDVPALLLDAPSEDEAAFDRELDATWSQATHAERRQKSDAATLKALENPKSRKAVYRTLALSSSLTDAQYRVLCHMLTFADRDLANAFPSRRAMARKIGCKVPTYDTHLSRLKKAGWVRTYAFMREGGASSSSGIQFCVPRGIINEEGWFGPQEFENHRTASPRR